MKKAISTVLVASGASLPLLSHAAIDLTPITGAFTATEITTAVLAVAAVLATVYATMKAVNITLGMLRGR